MKEKIFLLLFAMAFLISIPTHAVATPQEKYTIANLGYGLYFEATAPYETKAGEFISIPFRFYAEYDMRVDRISIDLGGPGIVYYKTLVAGVDIKKGTWITDTPMVKPTKEGMIHCKIIAEYSFWHGLIYYKQFGMININIAYARTTTYRELEEKYAVLKTEYGVFKEFYAILKVSYDKLSSDYAGLKSEHESTKVSYDKLKTDYDSLKVSYDILKTEHEIKMGELKTNTNLMYLFVITTIAFTGTTVFFARRKPKAT